MDQRFAVLMAANTNCHLARGHSVTAADFLPAEEEEPEASNAKPDTEEEQRRAHQLAFAAAFKHAFRSRMVEANN